MEMILRAQIRDGEVTHALEFDPGLAAHHPQCVVLNGEFIGGEFRTKQLEVLGYLMSRQNQKVFYRDFATAVWKWRDNFSEPYGTIYKTIKQVAKLIGDHWIKHEPNVSAEFCALIPAERPVIDDTLLKESESGRVARSNEWSRDVSGLGEALQIFGRLLDQKSSEFLTGEDFRLWISELARGPHTDTDSKSIRKADEENETSKVHTDVIPPEVNVLLDEGRELTERGRYQAADEKFRAALETSQTAGCATATIESHIYVAENQLLMQRDIGGARESLQSCLAQLPKSNCKRRQVVLALLGNAEVLTGNIESAKSLYRESLKIAQEQDDRFDEALQLAALSFAEEMLGNRKEAHSLLDKAVEIFRIEYLESQGQNKRKCAVNVGACLASKASLYIRQVNVPEALVNLSKAERFFREANSLDNLGRMLFLKSSTLLSDANWEPGLAVLYEALSTFESIDNIAWQCRCHEQIARLSLMFDNREQALSSLQKGVGLVLNGRYESEAVPHLLELASLYNACGELGNSDSLIRTANEIAIKTEDSSILAECFLAEAANIIKVNGEIPPHKLLNSALEHLKIAISACEIKSRRAEYMLKIGEVHRRLEDLNEAQNWVENALREFEEIGDVTGTAQSLSCLTAVALERKLIPKSVSLLERLLNVTKGNTLHRLRAGALHDFGAVKLSQGDLAGAKDCFAEATALAQKHKHKNVLHDLATSLEQTENATRFYQPPDRDFVALLDELRDWCGLYPNMKNAILPLWYYIHRAELWSICRSLLGVKLLICGSTVKSFERIADLFGQEVDLLVMGTSFVLKKEPRTELVPWPDRVLVPPEIKIVALKGEPSDTARIAKAVVNMLGKETYLLIPFNGPLRQFPGAQVCAFGRHIRLPSVIGEMVLDSAGRFNAERRICLPLSEGSKPAEPLHVMLVAWENRMIPVWSPRLPTGKGIEAVCDTAVTYPMNFQASERDRLTDIRLLNSLWENLLSSIGDVEHRTALLNLARELGKLMAAHPAQVGIQMRIYILRFRAAEREVLHPAIVIPQL